MELLLDELVGLLWGIRNQLWFLFQDQGNIRCGVSKESGIHATCPQSKGAVFLVNDRNVMQHILRKICRVE